MKQVGQIPKALQSRYDEIVALTDQVCQQHLTEEYGELCRQMAATLCRKRPSPVVSGKIEAWACGIAYALGKVNFLFDKSQQPYMRADELCRHFGVSPSTGSAKAKIILDRLDIMVMDPRWSLPSRLASNPLAWMIMVDGLPVDARMLPREIQEELVELGLIPFVP